MTSRRSAFVILGLLGVLLAAWLSFEFARGANPVADSEALAAFSFVLVGVIGPFILMRSPGHRLGWSLSATGLITVLIGAADSYARWSMSEGGAYPGTMFAAWLQNWLWFAPIGLVFTFCFMYFPDGQLPGPRWKIGARFAAVGLVGMAAITMLLEQSLDGFPTLANPTGLFPENGPIGILLAAAFGCVVIAILISVAGVIVRFRRSTGDERLQLKWVTYAVSIMTFLGLTAPFAPISSERLSDLGFGIVILLLPASIGVAVFRYRLYDIDVVINKTLVYLALSGILAVIYLGGVALIQSAIGLEEQGDVAVAASTLAVAALFQPARRWIQNFIDHYFYRRKYDAQKTIEAFSSRLRDEIDLSTLNSELLGVVDDTMQPRHASVWLVLEHTP